MTNNTPAKRSPRPDGGNMTAGKARNVEKGRDGAAGDSAVRVERTPETAAVSKQSRMHKVLKLRRMKRTKPTKLTLAASGQAKNSKPQIVQLGTGQKVAVEGLRDGEGIRYINCRIGTRTCLTPFALWHGSGGSASTALRDAGLVLVKGFSEVHDAVGEVKRFRRATIVTRYGWTGSSFAQSNNVVISPDDQPDPLTMLPPDSGLLAKSGTFDEWMEQVALPLAGHTLGEFAMMVMHVGPILRFTDRTDNFGFELSGDPGVGKSTLQILMASAAGPAVGNGDTTYWRSLNATPNALETTMRHFNDMTLILDEAALLAGSGKRTSRGEITREVAFRLSAGMVKHRLGEPASPRSRLVYMLSTNRSVSSLLGTAHGAEADAVSDRLMTLSIGADRPHGIFDSCPERYASTGDFAAALRHGAAEHYGHALPRLLIFLVKENDRQPDRLIRYIKSSIGKFVDECGADKGDGSQLRVAEAFGLVYAAGRLAKRARALPTSYRCMIAARAAYDLHRSQGRRPASFVERLSTVRRDKNTVDLTEIDLARLPAERLETARAFIYTGRSKQQELLVPIALINTVFPGWNGLRTDTEVLTYLKTSADRKVVTRPIGPGGKQVPVYCFDITGLVA